MSKQETQPPIETEVISSEQEGLQRLNAFLSERQDYSVLNPFTINLVDRNPHLSRPHTYSIYAGLMGERDLSFKIIRPQQGDGRLFVMPKRFGNGHMQYVWLDFYTNTINQLPFASCRLQPTEKITKMNFKSWHSIGEQLILDYLLQSNGVNFENLEQFFIQVPVANQGKQFVYDIACEPSLHINFHISQLVRPGTLLHVTPYKAESSDTGKLLISKVTPLATPDSFQTIASFQLNSDFNPNQSSPVRGMHKMEQTPSRNSFVDKPLPDNFDHIIFSSQEYGEIKPERYQLHDRSNPYDIFEAEVLATGGKHINDFLQGEQDFDSIKPFIIINYNLHHQNPYVPLGRRGRSGKPLAISLSEEGKALLDLGRRLYSLPKRYKDLYHWIEMYAVDSKESVDFETIVQSVLVDTEEKTVRKWEGIGLEIFLDFLAGKKPLRPEDLQEFTIQVSDAGYISRRVKENNVAFAADFTDNPQVQPEDKILFRPRFDIARNYFWVEGYVTGNDAVEHSVSSQRFSYGSLRPREWPGVEKQSLIDWIHGKLNFELAMDVDTTVTHTNKGRSIFISSKNHQRLVISIGDKGYIDYSRFKLIPRRDDLHEFIEVFPVTQEGVMLAKPMTTALIIRNGSRVKLSAPLPELKGREYIDTINEQIRPMEISPDEANEALKALRRL